MWCPVAVETRVQRSVLNRVIWRGFHVHVLHGVGGHLIIHMYWLLPMVATAIWLHLGQGAVGVPAAPCSHPLRRGWEFTDAVPTKRYKNMYVITVWCGGYIRL